MQGGVSRSCRKKINNETPVCPSWCICSVTCAYENDSWKLRYRYLRQNCHVCNAVVYSNGAFCVYQRYVFNGAYIYAFKTELVYLTGLFEIICAIGLLIPVSSVIMAWLLIAFFLLIVPADIHAAFRQLDYQKGTFDGSGLGYLWFRIPLQILFISWTYFCFIKR